MGIAAVGAKRSAVFLDRDGVLNHAIVRDGHPYSPVTVDEFTIVDGACEGLRQLRDMGFSLIVVTNQPDVARGKQTVAEIESMHRVLRDTLPLDDILVCFHDAPADCPCRKPRPGLLLEAQRKHSIEMHSSFMVGDRWSDVDAGHAAGCTTVLIDCHYRERSPTRPPDARVSDLKSAIEWIKETRRCGASTTSM